MPLSIVDFPYLADCTKLASSLCALPDFVWLDSGKPQATLSRFDIICAGARAYVVDGDAEQINSLVSQTAKLSPDELSQLDLLDVPFAGGVIGFFDYESNHKAHDMPKEASRKGASRALAFKQTFIIDHRRKRSLFIDISAPSEPSQFLSSLQAFFSAPNQEHQDRSPEAPNSTEVQSRSNTQDPAPTLMRSDQSKASFCEAIRNIHEHIREGDAYQINFSHEFSGENHESAFSLYLRCREQLAAPYSCFTQFEGRSILSFSPERFVAANGRSVLTQPIKGTIKRGKNETEDQQLAKTLLSSEKDRSENVMIVDLLRNDFSKSCKPHSVKVTKLFELKSFQNVHHLVSSIEGELEDEVSHWQFFFNCFPGGSITGAPKRRAMQIIFELERRLRGIYCGSIAYQSVHGRFDSSIAIRTVEFENQVARCAGGAGITIESNPESEFQETLSKIRPLLDALQERV